MEARASVRHRDEKGYRGSYLMKKDLGSEVEFITMMLWNSIDAIRAVVGPDYERSVIPEERRKDLSRHDHPIMT